MPRPTLPPILSRCHKYSTSSPPPLIPKPPPGTLKLPKLRRRVPHRLPTAEVPTPPTSPLLNPVVYLQYSKRHPKLPAPPPSPHSPLHLNPYAQILASPPRQDTDHSLRLPSLLLTRFQLKRDPATGNTWIVPSDDGTGTYALGTARELRGKCGKKREFSKLVPYGLRQKVLGGKGKELVYREDMDRFVGARMRRTVLELVGNGKWGWGSDFAASGGAERRGDGRMMGCVLDFRRGCEVERAVVRDGKTVPCHGMSDMLGDEVGEWVMEKLGVEENTKEGLVDVFMTVRTRLLQVELMRLRAFYELYYVPPKEHKYARVLEEEEQIPDWITKTGNQ